MAVASKIAIIDHKFIILILQKKKTIILPTWTLRLLGRFAKGEIRIL
ncbi:hypothetical protein FM120_18610 [Sphingobacterium faecium PCAi_F2.5]|nr:hypothetical protein FM120_18610 [Sphingobacterium faecium PCAi_F2.5]